MFCEIYESEELHFERTRYLHQVGSQSIEQEALEGKWLEKHIYSIFK